MRLVSLRLSGFKSFAQPSQVDFHPGVTAVVGPNGSGKSNIIDALRWCLGGGRAQAYRASDKRDLIFHGAKGQRALGYAEVEVRLEHHTRPIRVVRKMFRDGSLSLTLNGQNARLLDVDAELSGSGLGRGGLSLIGQGEISSVLMADASTLLGYLADAAGVATLSDRREQTLSRLGETRQHLDQLAQLLDERQRQLATLQKDAAAAKQARELERDRLQLRYTLSRRRVDDLTTDIARLRKEQVGLEHAIAEGKAQLSEQQKLRQQTVASLEQQRDALEQARQRAAAQESARQLASERLAARRAAPSVCGRRTDATCRRTGRARSFRRTDAARRG
ncbi:MAG: AAA family ATPase [Trueperaceae bacterium]|nr:AAA family ATPase [Trueperaceae bacterium]